MTLDELIAAAQELRTTLGGDAPVVILTPRGYTEVQLAEGLGFADAAGNFPASIVLIAPA